MNLIQIEALVAENTGRHHIVEALIGDYPVFKKDVLIFLRLEPATLTCMFVPLKDARPHLRLDIGGEGLIGLCGKVLGIGRPRNAQNDWIIGHEGDQFTPN